MNYVRIYDNYFIGTFPGATGILYKDEHLNAFISIPRDSGGNFEFEWNSNVVYQLVYADDYRNRSLSSSSSSNRWEFPYWLRVAVGIFVMWIGSIIPSLWSNIYEEIVKKISYPSINHTVNKSYLMERIIVLLIISILYVISIVFVTPVLMNSICNKVKTYIQNIELETLTYNALSPPPLVLP
ncbi:unnamed protein product [Rotaria socialis]|uniref:Uncharacterized protein n=1 Tax=Rotaria socialis TaxID=392032 RepID=A0A819BSB7_9BILA|nr:unnamed protein product [Rotaria socialis]